MTELVISEKDVEDLIYGQYSLNHIIGAVNDDEWQELRKSLKKMSTQEKIEKLREYRDKKGETQKIKIQITNYINALKRGGLIK